MNMNGNPLYRERDPDNLSKSERFRTFATVSRSHEKEIQSISLMKLFSDSISLVLVFVAWLLFKYLVKPVRRAFLCSDLSLYHRLSERRVFPTWLLFICAILIPLIIIILSECVRWFYLHRKTTSKLVYKLEFRSKIYYISGWLGNFYIIIGTVIFAIGVNMLLTNIGKVAVGRLRPHFIATCFHDYSYQNFCTHPNLWIVNYTCVGESDELFKGNNDAYDVRQSFPSGHASIAFCGLIFLALYIHKFWNHHNFGLFPYLIQMSCFALASYISITRITDNRHHPTDVLAGAILGTLVALIAFLYMVVSLKRSVLLHQDNESVRV